MALNLTTPLITQSNDAVTIQVADTTGVYNVSTNLGGWGTPNPEVSILDGETYHLYLDITITTSTGTETVYDPIELAAFGPFNDPGELVFNITSDMLVDGSISLGTVLDTFPDGWYSFTLRFVDDGATYTNSTTTTALIIDGVVSISVYDKLRDIPYSTDWKLFNHDYKEWYDILYPMYYNGLLEGMNALEDVSRKNQIIDMLGTLERLLNN